MNSLQPNNMNNNSLHQYSSPFTAVLVRPIQSSSLAAATALPVCAASGRLSLSILRRYFPAATGLVFEGPLGLTSVPSKISSSLEGQLIFLLPEPSYVYLVISNPIVEEKGGRRGDRNNSEPFPMALSSKEATHFLADTKKDEMAALREEVAALWEEVVFLGKAGSTSKEELTATKEEMATLKRADDTSKAELAAMREEMGLMKVALTEELRSVNVLADKVEEIEKCLMKEGRVSKSHHASSDVQASSVGDTEGSDEIKAMSGKGFEDKAEDLMADLKPQHVSHEVSMDVNNNMEHIGDDENGSLVAQEEKVSDIVSSYTLEYKKKVGKAQEIGEENLVQDQVDLDFINVKPKMKVKKSHEGTKETSKSDVDTSVGILKVDAESVVSDQVAPVVPEFVSVKPKKSAEKSHEGTKEEESTAPKQDTEIMGNNSAVPNFVSVKPKKKAERSLGGTKEEESTDVEAAPKHDSKNVGNSSVIQDFVSVKPKKKVEKSLEDAKEAKKNEVGESVAVSKLAEDNVASDSVVQDFVSIKPKMVKKVKK